VDKRNRLVGIHFLGEAEGIYEGLRVVYERLGAYAIVLEFVFHYELVSCQFRRKNFPQFSFRET
jgi:hypothetical protein